MKYLKLFESFDDEEDEEEDLVYSIFDADTEGDDNYDAIVKVDKQLLIDYLYSMGLIIDTVIVHIFSSGRTHSITVETRNNVGDFNDTVLCGYYYIRNVTWHKYRISIHFEDWVKVILQ